MNRFSFKKVLNYSMSFTAASLFFSSFGHAADGRNAIVPNRAHVSMPDYVIIILVFGLLYAIFLFLRNRRRKKYNEIVLRFTK